MRLLLVLILLPPAVGCENTTDGARFDFRAAREGPDVDPADVGNFVNRLGFDVALSKAILHVGAIYLNESATISTADDQYGCYGGGRDVGQVLGGLDIDLLSSSPQEIPVLGQGTESHARAAAILAHRPGARR